MRIERPNTVRLPFVVSLGVVVWPMLAGVAFAQQDDEAPGPPEELQPGRAQSDVYLDDSFEADEWIAKAVRQAAARPPRQ